MTAGNASIFSYPVEDCDVQDRTKLVEFRTKVEVWDGLLNQDQASISEQFSEMMWTDALWRVANEARHYVRDRQPNASVAPLLATLLDRGFLAGQVIAITRLLEPSDPKNPKRGVVSLRRLVDDIKASRHLITREVFVAQDALPYDWETVEQTALADIAKKAANADGVIFTRGNTHGPKAFDVARRQHELFDKLSGSQPRDRSRCDTIDASFFKKLERLIDDPLFEQIKSLRNKSIAHAADEFSRSQAGDVRAGLTLDEFSRAQYLLFAVYQTLSVVFLGQWRGSVVPTAQNNVFEHLEGSFIQQPNLDDAKAFWDAHCEERRGWTASAYHEVVPE